MKTLNITPRISIIGIWLSSYLQKQSFLPQNVKKDDTQEAKNIFQKHNEKLKQSNPKPEFYHDIINDTQLWGWSSVHVAVYFGHEKLYLWLLSEGGSVQQTTLDNWDCLTLATSQGNLTMVTLLLGQQNIDVNHVSCKGTALHIAAKNDYVQILLMLLTHPSINLFLINDRDQTPFDVAAKKTKTIIQEEIQKHNRQFSFANDQLMKSFRQSVTNFFRLTHLSQNSFIANMPRRPPIIKGTAQKLGIMNLFSYERFFMLDPESGVLARFRTEEDCPLNPHELIPLDSIEDIVQESDRWFQRDDLYYIRISYGKKSLYMAFQYEQTMKQWMEILSQCIGYVKYCNGKISQYFTHEQKEKAHKRIVQAMLEMANKEIVIVDINTFAQQDTNYRDLSETQDLYRITLREDYEILESNRQSEFSSHHQLGIKDFDFISLLGKGSFGNVYKVRSKLNGKIYALKQQDKEKLDKVGHIKYAKCELDVLKKIYNPFLVNLHCAFQTPKYLYLVLDLSSQGDLSNYMTRGVILDEMTAKFLMAEILMAIAYLHSKNIIYRDLKPENLSLDEEGHIKLIDFGLSKVGSHKDFVAMSFCGSPAYLSPELIRGEGATTATDVYTMGTILYEMLTGYPPHYCGKLDQLFHDIRYTKVTISKNLSKAAQDLLRQMLEKDPRKRIRTEKIFKHMFFAEIDWSKISQKKYVPPKLVQKFGFKKKDKSNSNLEDLQLDADYKPFDTQNYIKDWNFQ